MLHDSGRNEFDKTSLRLNHAGSYVHRDYAAHFFRWGFALRFIKGHTRVLDIGCGDDQPLERILSYQRVHVPKEVVGVDYGNGRKRIDFKWFDHRPKFDFNKRYKEIKGTFETVCCFEVIEHMPKTEGRKLLRAARTFMKTDSVFLLSTPCFNGKAARNHVHEYTVEELRKEILAAGFKIEKRFGTFMNVIRNKEMLPEHRKVFRDLRNYYDDEVLSCFLAPFYPDLARNNIWVLRK